MKPVWTSSQNARFDDGTCWPITELPAEYGDAAAHQLRYAANISASARYHGASVIEAYEHLIEMPLSQSREVLRALKAAVKQRDEDAQHAAELDPRTYGGDR